MSFYITTPIYYVNDVPHLGHAYTSIAADVLVRFLRLDNHKVRFITGTDEHGQKIEKAAQVKGLSPQEFVNKMNQSFVGLGKLLNLSNDDYIRTSEERHHIAVMSLWEKLYSKGYIYLGYYTGWYSVRDEAFFKEDELQNGLTPTGAPVEWVEEQSYFFKLSSFQEQLLTLYEQERICVLPLSKRNEVIAFIKSGLSDLSISRTKIKWGIKVPQDPKYVIYVWLDALANYISALGFPNIKNPLYEEYWKQGNSLHIIGKDILRFHAIYWPAFLLAADLPLPHKIFAHGWWLVEGAKMSKSLGNVINPYTIVQQFGVDYIRYFLMREIVFGNDGNFSTDLLISKVNTELANNIGNLVHRTLTLISNKFAGTIALKADNNLELLHYCYKVLPRMRLLMQQQKIYEAIGEIIQLATLTNEYMHQQQPWKLLKSNPIDAQQVLANIFEIIRCIGILLLPFIPGYANAILDQLKIPSFSRKFSCLTPEEMVKAHHTIATPIPIFKKLDNSALVV